jgi:predicted hydrocarbon binding protein
MKIKNEKQRIFPVHFAPGKKLVHVVVRLSDAPGSLSSILDLLAARVNLVGTTTYANSDGTALFSGFAEALSTGETAEGLRALILMSKAAKEADVVEGNEGLLVDTFHTGFVVGDEDYVLLRREGMAQMFDRVSKMLGSGGETLLVEEGKAMGQWNASSLAKRIGTERIRANSGALNRLLAAQGLGEVETRENPGGGFTVTVADCFECSGRRRSRTACSFMRGYLVGFLAEEVGKDFDSVEEKCRLNRGEVCEFNLTTRK